MPKHTVKQGEHLSRIATEAGFSDPGTIWEHPENAPLRQRRENPNVLMPGDELHIPDRELREESRPTERRHRFRRRGHQVALRIRLLDFDNRSLPNTPCELRVEGRVFSLETDSDGRIEQPILSTDEDALLIFTDPLVPFEVATRIRIGHLDPVEEASGQKARLTNLGYFAPHEDDGDKDRFEHAIQEFQCDHGLEVDGICGPATRAKLKEVHGC